MSIMKFKTWTFSLVLSPIIFILSLPMMNLCNIERGCQYLVPHAKISLLTLPSLMSSPSRYLNKKSLTFWSVLNFIIFISRLPMMNLCNIKRGCQYLVAHAKTSFLTLPSLYPCQGTFQVPWQKSLTFWLVLNPIIFISRLPMMNLCNIAVSYTHLTLPTKRIV